MPHGGQAFEIDVVEAELLANGQNFTCNHAATDHANAIEIRAIHWNESEGSRLLSSQTAFKILETIMRATNLVLSIGLIAGSIIALSGCANTIRGVGQDTANTVNATQNAARRTANAAGS